MHGIELIAAKGQIIAFVIRANATASETTFFTAEEVAFQAGFVAYPAGGEVAPHVHLPIERRVIGTSELLIVRSGRCEVDLYAQDRRLVATCLLGSGDAVLALGGGHGFRMLEDTVLLEIKQGPFTGNAEKERFTRPGMESGGA